MNVCILTTTFPRHERDYLGSFILGQARELAEQGSTVHVFVPHDPTLETLDDTTVDGVHVHRFHYWVPHRWEKLCYGAGIPENFRRNRLLAVQLPALIAAFILRALPFVRDCDIVHGHWSFAGVAAWVVGRLTGKKVVVTMHGAEALSQLLAPVNRLLVRHTDAIVVNSTFTRQALIGQSPDADPIVIPFGINPEKIALSNIDHADLRASVGIDSDTLIVLAVGRLVERKGFHVLIEAASLLSPDLQARVVIGGQGPEREALQRRIEELGVSDRVDLLGYIDDRDLAGWYATADVFVLPAVADSSGDTEGLGMVLIEAMANETPVVASDIGGIVDIVEHDQTGLLVPAADAQKLAEQIERILRNSTLRNRLALGATQKVEEQFSWKEIGERLIACYGAILRNSR